MSDDPPLYLRPGTNNTTHLLLFTIIFGGVVCYLASWLIKSGLTCAVFLLHLLAIMLGSFDENARPVLRIICTYFLFPCLYN